MKKALGKTLTTLSKIKTWQEYCVEKSIKSSTTKYHPVVKEINSKLSLWKGDITLLSVDAIVNAAKSSLLGGGGVDGAIHAAAGNGLLKECKTLGFTKPGDAKLSKGYNLPASYVIHAVGPQDKDPAVLKSAYERALSLTEENSIKSIAFPCISTGIFGFPREDAAGIAADVARQFLKLHMDRMERIIFVVWDEIDEKFYENQLPKYFPVDTAADGRECCDIHP